MIELKGIIANKGKVEGKAKVIISLDEIENFKKGEILVTDSTDPNFLPIFMKCIAIISEKGGLTSHTAIIAREFNIPCIVGVNNLLKNIKTGDNIKVDANDGKIYKL